MFKGFTPSDVSGQNQVWPMEGMMCKSRWLDFLVGFRMILSVWGACQACFQRRNMFVETGVQSFLENITWIFQTLRFFFCGPYHGRSPLNSPPFGRICLELFSVRIVHKQIHIHGDRAFLIRKLQVESPIEVMTGQSTPSEIRVTNSWP